MIPPVSHQLRPSLFSNVHSTKSTVKSEKAQQGPRNPCQYALLMLIRIKYRVKCRNQTSIPEHMGQWCQIKMVHPKYN
jgi:hypothetical protein